MSSVLCLFLYSFVVLASFKNKEITCLYVKRKKKLTVQERETEYQEKHP